MRTPLATPLLPAVTLRLASPRAAAPTLLPAMCIPCPVPCMYTVVPLRLAAMPGRASSSSTRVSVCAGAAAPFWCCWSLLVDSLLLHPFPFCN